MEGDNADGEVFFVTACLALVTRLSLGNPKPWYGLVYIVVITAAKPAILF